MALRICARSLRKERLSYSSSLNALYLHTPRDSIYGKKFVGFITWDRHSKIGELVDLRVDSDFQKQGIGRYLIEQVVNDLKSNRLRQLFLTSTPETVEYWRKHGFVVATKLDMPDDLQHVARKPLFIRSF